MEMEQRRFHFQFHVTANPKNKIKKKSKRIINEEKEEDKRETKSYPSNRQDK